MSEVEVWTGATVARRSPLADARQAEQDALNSPNPWIRSRALAGIWLDEKRASTSAAYKGGWRGLWRWSEEIRVAPLNLRRSDLNRWGIRLQQVGPNLDPAAPRPIGAVRTAWYLSVASSYLRRAVEEDMIPMNPARDMQRPELDRISPQPHLTEEEMTRLLDAAGVDGPVTLTLVCLLMLDYQRVSAVLGADITNLDEVDGIRCLRLRIKGARDHVVPLPEHTWRAVQAAIGDRTEGPLILNKSGTGRMLRQQAWREVRRIALGSGIREDKARRIGPHTLRHAGITYALGRGIPIERVSGGAGHASSSTTALYNRVRGNVHEHPAAELEAALTAAGAARRARERRDE